MADAKAMMDAVISIHAPRTGSDAKLDGKMVAVCISIHAPRTGSDSIVDEEEQTRIIFQSTLPARGATSH